MPGSLPTFKREVAAHIREQIADGAPAVDIGPGMGWWSDLVGHGRMDCVEIFAPYVERYGLRSKYRQTIVNNVLAVEPRAYGWRFAIMGDVLEHLTVEEAQYVVRTWTAQGCRLLVAVPFLSPQEATADNEHEAHLQTDLTPEVMAARYPELHPLIIGPEYGYYVSYDADVLIPDGLPPIEPPQRVHVLWWEGARGYWDHGMIMHAVEGSLHPTPRPYTYVQHEHEREVGNTGAVAIVSGRWAQRNADDFKAWSERRAWSLACVTSDEESELDPHRIKVPTSLVTLQTPPASASASGIVRRFHVLGIRPDTRASASGIVRPPAVRDLMWSFSGQVRDNVARQDCVRVLQAMHGADTALTVTGGFGQGHPHRAYLEQLARTEIAPSPSGPQTPDCFRTWEALEMGCLPVAQAHSPRQRYAPDYYAHALCLPPDDVPFPRVREWSEFRAIVERYRGDRLALTRAQNRAFSWWQRFKRQFVLDLETDIGAVSGMVPVDHPAGLRSKMTILIPSSVIPSHPDTAVIDECIARLRAYPDLAECEIILMIDGVRAEQAHRAGDFAEYTRRVLWKCNTDPAWRGVVPMVFEQHTHQAEMTRQALAMVQTPLVFFVEHDTWPVGEIPFAEIAHAVDTRAGGLRMLRLHYDVQVHPSHEYLMRDPAPVDCAGVPVRRTRQWSQRPHIARTDFYRHLISEFFTPGDRTMIEDAIYGPGESGSWERFGLGIYAPPGDMKRSATCDGRKDDPKYPMVYRGKVIG